MKLMSSNLLLNMVAWFCVISFVAVSSVALSTLSSDLTLGSIALVLGFCFILLIAYSYPSVAVVLITAFFVRALLAIVHAYAFALPDSYIDARVFEETAWQWSKGGFIGTFQHFTTGAFFYPWLVSLLYALTGRSELMMQAINVLFGTLVIFNIFLISNRLWSYKVAIRASWVAALFPSLMLYSAITMREVAVIYPLTLSVLSLIRWYQLRKVSSMALAIFFAFISTLFHTGMIVVLAGLTLLAFIGVFRSWSQASRGSALQLLQYTVVVIVLTAFSGIILTTGSGLEKIGSVDALNVESLSRQQEWASRARASYLENLIARTPIDILWQTPIRIAYFLFAPFPWMINTAGDLITAIDAALYGVLVISLLRARKLLLANTPARACCLIIICILVTFSLTTSNYGTALRHRAKLAPLLIATLPIISFRYRQNRLLSQQQRLRKGDQQDYNETQRQIV